MQDIEPFYSWMDLYSSKEDELSPFYGREYSEFEYSNTIYNYFIHPQWDDFGSTTLYLKVIYCDYDQGFAIIEFIGEWNDAISNDIMLLKRDVIESMMGNGVKKFVLIGENVLNFHASDDEYYQEWFEDVSEEGWIAVINFRQHVLDEMQRINIDYYLIFGGELNELNWRIFRPQQLMLKIDNVVRHRIGS